MIDLPPGVFRYLLIGQSFVPFFINIVVNIAIGMLSLGDRNQ